ncbi:MAG: GGDEF domain-containing protein [Holophaga sp.]|nr:GGDEF domain-containing protein [Holophaga sp.]
MSTIHWIDIHPSDKAPALREALARWGFQWDLGPGDGTLLMVADRPDPAWIPPEGTEILWWVADATPEAASEVLSCRPGWVVRQDQPLEMVRTSLVHIQTRDLGSEGWLRQMLHLASLDELLRPILKRAVQLSGAKGGAIWIRKDDICYQRFGDSFPEHPLTLPEAAGLVQTGQAWLLCPTEQVGLLRLLEPCTGPEHFLGFLREVEDLIINAWNLEHSQALSFADDLTVANNRRCLEVELPQIIRDASVRSASVALLFLDVDNLKALNSRYGHPTGSKVIARVALEAKRMIRLQDHLYRYGGDEFCIVIPGGSAFGARKLGERLILALGQASMIVGSSRVPMSLSIGIATYPLDADGAEHLLEKADRALFKAKASGKGCVVVAE